MIERKDFKNSLKESHYYAAHLLQEVVEIQLHQDLQGILICYLYPNLHHKHYLRYLIPS